MASLEPAALFQHPAVQYIPIGVEELWHGPAPTHHATSLIIIEPPTGEDGYVYFSASGVRVTQCHYRAHQAILVGQPELGHVQRFRLTKQYFYKPFIVFDLFDWQARPLASVSSRIK